MRVIEVHVGWYAILSELSMVEPSLVIPSVRFLLERERERERERGRERGREGERERLSSSFLSVCLTVSLFEE